jgi:hypothetical protein
LPPIAAGSIEASTMRKKLRRSRRSPVVIPVWSPAQATAALPYLLSILRSLREHRLDWNRCIVAHRRITRAAGPLNRARLVAQDDLRRAAASANRRFREARSELRRLGVICLDPIQGAALLPSRHDDQLAWYLINLFDPQPLRFWRFHATRIISGPS